MQNELIDLLSSKIIFAIVDDIKQAKFFFNNSGLHPRYKPHRTVVSGHSSGVTDAEAPYQGTFYGIFGGRGVHRPHLGIHDPEET